MNEKIFSIGQLSAAGVLGLFLSVWLAHRLARSREMTSAGKAAQNSFWETMNAVLCRSLIRNQNNPFADLEKQQIRVYEAFYPHVRWQQRRAFKREWDNYYERANKFFDDSVMGPNPEQTTETMKLIQKQIEALMDFAK